MGIKLTRDSGELHPEGLFLFCIREIAETTSKYGPQLKIQCESTERGEDGSRLVLTYFTGTKISSHPECKIHNLLVSCGLEPDELEDTDDLIGAVFCGKVEENADGTRTNIVKVFPKSKLKKEKPAAVAKAKVADGFTDPFADE